MVMLFHSIITNEELCKRYKLLGQNVYWVFFFTKLMAAFNIFLSQRQAILYILVMNPACDLSFFPG